MRTFYFFLWIRWGIRVSVCSISLALISSLLLTFFIYVRQGIPSLSSDIFLALSDVMIFWFPLTWSATLLIALFRSLKYIFNYEIKGYKLHLLECSTNEILEDIGYGDLVKVWRKWFLLMIWLVSSQVLITLSISYLFKIHEWFSIYILFVFILLGGYASLVLLAGRCKNVRIVKC